MKTCSVGPPDGSSCDGVVVAAQLPQHDAYPDQQLAPLVGRDHGAPDVGAQDQQPGDVPPPGRGRHPLVQVQAERRGGGRASAHRQAQPRDLEQLEHGTVPAGTPQLAGVEHLPHLPDGGQRGDLLDGLAVEGVREVPDRLDVERRGLARRPEEDGRLVLEGVTDPSPRH